MEGSEMKNPLKTYARTNNATVFQNEPKSGTGRQRTLKGAKGNQNGIKKEGKGYEKGAKGSRKGAQSRQMSR